MCRLGIYPAKAWYTMLRYFSYPWRVGYDTGISSEQCTQVVVVVVEVNME